VWKLLRLRLVILLSGFRRARLRRKIGMLVLALVILAVLGAIFAFSWFLLSFLQSPLLAEQAGELLNPFLDSVPGLLVAGAFIGILLTSFGVLLQALYLAGDMDFLLSAPVPIRAVFITKLLQAILPSFGLICLFALPVLFGLGASRGYNFLYYPLVVLELVALALAAAGVSGLLVMAVVRIFPARRVAEVLGFAGAILSFLCSQSGNLARWNEFNPDQASQALSIAQRFNTPWMPLAWAGRGLIDIGEARWLSGGVYVILTLGISALAFAVALTTAERLYYTGWASLQARAQKKKVAPRHTKPARTKPLVAFIETQVPSAVRAIVIKDWLVLRRDLRNMSQLITPLIIGIIYAIMFFRSGGQAPPGRGEAPEWVMQAMNNALVYANIGLALFVGWMLIARLAGMGFSQEGKNYWMLKSAPVSVSRLIAAKFLVAYLPVLVMSWLFLVGFWLVQQSGWQNLLFALPLVALSIAGNAGMNLAFGIAGANMDWEDPRQMQKGGSSCLSVIASMLYLPLSLGLFFGPALLASVLKLPDALGQIVGLILGGVFSLLCAILPLWLVRKRVPRLGEA
jgi:ABC-2 type transport system permease protein